MVSTSCCSVAEAVENSNEGVEFLGSPPLAGRVELIERTCRGVVTFQFQGDEAEIILCFQISWRAHRPHEVTERSDVVIGR